MSQPGGPEGRVTPWRNASSADALQLVAEGVATFGGFKMTTIMIVRGARVECVAAAGPDDMRDQAIGMVAPTRFFQETLDTAEQWGLLRFIPHDRVTSEADRYTILPDIDEGRAADAWHPRDELLIPVHDANGELRAVLSVAEPIDARRPGPAQRQRLEDYAVHAMRAILTTLEREELAERISVTEAARRVVRAASSDLAVGSVLTETRGALLDGFRADGLWWRLFPAEGDSAARGRVEQDGDDLGPVLPGLDPRAIAVAAAVAHHAWDVQQVVTASAARPLALVDSYPADTVAISQSFLSGDGVGSVLIIPLGAGKECLGLAVLHRRDGSEWTPVEAEAALDVGRDLGRAVLNARLYERELDLVHRLQALDAYKSRLISTISHELRTPLTSVVGNLELMMDLLEEDERDETLVAAAAATGRGARRLSLLVDDLLLLSRVDDPDSGSARQRVDLRGVLADVAELHESTARGRRVELVVEVSDEPVVVLGDAVQLDRLLVNLLGNAVKYSRHGGTVRVDVEHQGTEVVVSCADDGLGISDADQQSIFGEFFRSGDPRVREISGSGLGLAISRRIVDSHGGRIELSSRIGAGSTFRVFLPAAPQ